MEKEIYHYYYQLNTKKMKHIKTFVILMAGMMMLGACNQKKAEVAETTPVDNIYQFCVLNGTGDTVRWMKNRVI